MPAESRTLSSSAARASPSNYCTSLGSRDTNFTSNLPPGAILRLYQTHLQSWPQRASSGLFGMLQTGYVIQFRARKEVIQGIHAGSSPLYEFRWQQGSQKCGVPVQLNDLLGKSKVHFLEEGYLSLQQENIISLFITSRKQFQIFLTQLCELRNQVFPWLKWRLDQVVTTSKISSSLTYTKGQWLRQPLMPPSKDPAGSARALQASHGDKKQTDNRQSNT